jgi:hypothetical protein
VVQDSAIRNNAEIAQQWAAGLARDIRELGALMAPSTRVWHSHDGIWLTLAESSARIPEAPPGESVAPIAFQNVRAQATQSGVVVQATMPGGAFGSELPTHIAQVLTVENGLVVQVEEYIAAQSPAA